MNAKRYFWYCSCLLVCDSFTITTLIEWTSLTCFVWYSIIEILYEKSMVLAGVVLLKYMELVLWSSRYLKNKVAAKLTLLETDSPFHTATLQNEIKLSRWRILTILLIMMKIFGTICLYVIKYMENLWPIMQNGLKIISSAAREIAQKI